MIVGLTSSVYDKGTLYDAASTIMQQRLSQVQGVGQVSVGGSSLPGVRVDVNPTQLNSYGLGLQDVASMLSQQNANSPKGQITDEATSADVTTNDQLLRAADYMPLVVGYHNGAAVKLSDIAQVYDSTENIRAAGYVNGKPSVLIIIYRQPGANIIETVDRIRAAIPSLRASVPSAIDTEIVLDRTQTIRASVHDVERSLMISISLVILVVFLFLRNVRATLIPSVAVPASLIGTFGVMYLCHYSIDNLSLMALTISTGFVVDDAIVVIENITRYIEQGMAPAQAALRGAKEIGFTVLSISISLVAVFIPILMMGGIVGRLFREFAVTLSVAILVSLVISLTTTPMMCSRLLQHIPDEERGKAYRASERAFNSVLGAYERSLGWVLEHSGLTLTVLAITIGINIYLFWVIPFGFFPQQDNGLAFGGIQGPQDVSFQAMQKAVQRIVSVVKTDPAVDNAMAFTGGGGPTNGGFIFMGLKPFSQRHATSSQIIDRLRPKLLGITGANTFLQAGQDVRIGGRASSAQYQYTIQSDSVQNLVEWGPVLLQQMRKLKMLRDVNTDQQNSGLQARLTYDRATASRLGITPEMLDNSMYEAFGQAQVSTMYTAINQYHVVLEVEPQFWQSPVSLNDVYIRASQGKVVPLSAIAHYEPATAPLAVNHQGQYPSVTISFNLAPGISLSQAVAAITGMEQKIGLPSTVTGMFSGTLQAFKATVATLPFLLVTALAAVYIVLGILYESYVHPITILSTLPSAGVGAVLALMIFHKDLSLTAIIGVILLIGIVKKNAIMMIDFALAAERNEGKSPRDAIFQACILRFRPILMTTMAALFGALPLAFGTGPGSELRNPLGITIIGGLLLSQMLTLYTTPVVYLSLDRMRVRWLRAHGKLEGQHELPSFG
jgi:multidrug efflux pump